MKYFMMVGATPKACANAFAWYIRSNSGPPVDELKFICSSDRHGGQSATSISNVMDTVHLIKENLVRISPEALEPLSISETDILWIPEADLGTATQEITRGILDRTTETDEIVIDPTAGRKLMSASAVLSAVLLYQRYSRDVQLSYYWLIRFTKENLQKMAYELGIDDAETVIVEMGELDEKIKEIENQDSHSGAE